MKDIRGTEIKVGDTLAVAMRSGTRSTLRVGTILEIYPDTTEVVIQWTDGPIGYLPDKPGIIKAYEYKVAVI